MPMYPNVRFAVFYDEAFTLSTIRIYNVQRRYSRSANSPSLSASFDFSETLALV
jgi:hypothetical protein